MAGGEPRLGMVATYMREGDQAESRRVKNFLLYYMTAAWEDVCQISNLNSKLRKVRPNVASGAFLPSPSAPIFGCATIRHRSGGIEVTDVVLTFSASWAQY